MYLKRSSHLFPRLLFGVALLLLLFVSVAEAYGSPLRFVGAGQVSGRNFSFINGSGFHNTSFLTPTLVDATIDEESQSIVYNRYEFTLPEQMNLTNETTYLIPGTFNTLDINTTVTLNMPSFVAVTDTPALDLILTEPNSLTVESSQDGSLASFPLLEVSGEYSIAGPNENVSGTFSTVMDIFGDNHFPQDSLRVAEFPNSIVLSHRTQGTNEIRYTGPGVIYSGFVEGFLQELHIGGFNLTLPFSRPAQLLPDADLDGDGYVSGSDLLEWQRNPAIGSISVWEAQYGGVPPISANVPEPNAFVLGMFASCMQVLRRRRL